MTNLRKKVFSASRWTSIAAVSKIVLQILQTATLARLLSPADFGLMAIATTIIGILMLLIDLGFSQALIHFDDTSCEFRSSLYWLNMILASSFMLLLIVLSPSFSKWYHTPELTTLLYCISLIFPLSAAGQQLRALASRELRFDILAINELASALAGFACSVVAALLGAGVYSLAIGLLVGTSLDTALAWTRLPTQYRPSFHCKLSETKPFLKYGFTLIGGTLCNTINRNTDIFIGGLAASPDHLGFYSIPRGLALNGAMIVNSIVTKIGFPVMSRVKNEPERLKNIYLHSMRMTASVNFPVYIALGIFSNEVVAFLYGSQWHEAATYLRILAIWGLIRSTHNPVGSLLYACGKTRKALYWDVLTFIIVTPTIWLVTHEGNLFRLACFMLAWQVVIFIPAWRFLVYPCCQTSLLDYLKQFAPPLFCALIAGGFAWLVSFDINAYLLKLVTGCSFGCVVYLGLSYLFNRQWVTAMTELLRIKNTHNT